ncbi:predicted protein [Histoplasma capsulatum G186AR]|uniref:Uncharacterized protein n=1 Tax=Ajellomyces capsulatus (strain G186AR / H82 / ATCC MYA-2454 / RMSCC 2432) TaxID=447093 RepID=C0NHQ3_AJECG|nr:uncharacterized protein HCBG_02875 [Histoplasma capsulatum G186AR]EEH09338.1 predicted protein [Histoplasma capsulatum G186AR]
MQAESTIIPDSRKSTIPRRHVFSRGGSWAKHLQPITLRVHSGRKTKKHASFTIYGRELRPVAAAHFTQRVVLLGPPSIKANSTSIVVSDRVPELARYRHILSAPRETFGGSLRP